MALKTCMCWVVKQGLSSEDMACFSELWHVYLNITLCWDDIHHCVVVLHACAMRLRVCLSGFIVMVHSIARLLFRLSYRAAEITQASKRGHFKAMQKHHAQLQSSSSEWSYQKEMITSEYLASHIQSFVFVEYEALIFGKNVYHWAWFITNH